MQKSFFLFLILSALFVPIYGFSASDTHLWQEKIVIQEEVHGEAVLGGGEIRVESPIGHDLIVFGEEVDIQAPVGQDLRALGRSIVINSSIEGNVTLVGETVTIGRGGRIKGNLYALTSRLVIEGAVEGAVRSRSESVVIKGEVGGDLNLGRVISLNVQEGALVNGNVRYQAEKPVTIPADSVGGRVDFDGIAYERNPLKRVNWFWEMVSFFAAIAVGIIAINFFERQMKEITIVMVKSPWRVMLFGLVFIFIVPIASVLLLITLIGIPIGLITLGIWLALLYISPLLSSVIVGKLFAFSFVKEKKNLKSIPMFWFLIGGLVFLNILFLIPLIGGVLEVMAVLWGFGGIMSYFKQLFRHDVRAQNN